MHDKKGRILAVDADQLTLAGISHILGNEYDAHTCLNPVEAGELLKSLTFDILIMESKKAADQIDLLKESLKLDPNLRVIVIDALGSVETAVKVMRAGAFDYMAKPFAPEKLSVSVNAALKDRKERLENKYREDIFYEIKTAVASSLNIEKVLDSIVNGVAKAIKAKGSALSLLGRSHSNLRVVATHGLNKSYLVKGPIDSSKSLAETTQTGKPVWIRDATVDSRIQYPDEAKKEGIASILSVPLKIRGEVIGALRVYTSEEREFSEQEIRILEDFAAQAAFSIQNAKQYEDVKNEYDNLREELRMYFDEIGWD